MAFVILTLGIMLAGLDQVSAFAAVATCSNNLGPDMGRVSGNFTDVSDGARRLGVAAMLPDAWRYSPC